MTDYHNYLSDDDATRWIEHWGSVFWTLAGLLGLKVEQTMNTIPGHVDSVLASLVINPTIQAQTGNVSQFVSIDPAAPSALRELAEDVLDFSAQHFAFVLDTFYGGQYFRLSAERSFANFNDWHRHKFVETEFGDGIVISGAFADYALRRVISQFSKDVLALHDIWAQTATIDAISTNTIGVRREANLNLARNVQRTFAMFLPTTGEPWIYLRSSAGTRLIPASNQSLISVPPTALLVPSESLTIPHEYGHYLFWRGKCPSTLADDGPTLLRDRLHARLQNSIEGQALSPTVGLAWREEVFSDVVAVLFGGPVVVRSLMQMMKEKVGRLLIKDNGHHPIPAARPFAAFAVIARVSSEDTASSLRNEWTAYLEARNEGQPVEDFELKLDAQDEDGLSLTSTLGVLRADLKVVAEAIVDLLVDEGLDLEACLSRWSDCGDVVQAVGKLTEPPAVTSETTENDPSPTIKSRSWADTIHAAMPAQTDGRQAFGGAVFADRQWALDKLSLSQAAAPTGGHVPVTLTFDEWVSVLALGGWGDAGPTGGSPIIT